MDAKASLAYSAKMLLENIETCTRKIAGYRDDIAHLEEMRDKYRADIKDIEAAEAKLSEPK